MMINALEFPEKKVGDQISHNEFNNLVASVKQLIDVVNNKVRMKSHLIPYANIDGVSDEDGVITGTKTFDLPGDIDTSKLIIVFSNGVKVKSSIAGTQITLEQAPLGDGTENSSVVEVLYYPTV